MDKRQFSELISYLSNRPAEAERLRKILGPVTSSAPRWVTAREAGCAVGMSAKWIKDHVSLFPNSRKVKRGSMYSYMFDLQEVKLQYDNFVKSNTL